MSIEYEKTRELMVAFWPGAENSVAVRELFRERLEYLNQTWLRNAVKEVRASYSSKTPELKWILAEYRKISNNDRDSFGKSDNVPSAVDEEHERQVALEDRHCTFELELLTDEQLASAIGDMGRANPWAKGLMGRTAGRPSEWSKLARGLIWAYLSSQSTPSQSRNQGQEPSGLVTE